MKTNLLQLLILTSIFISCSKAPANENSTSPYNRGVATQKFKCDITNGVSTTNVDRCLIKACEIVGGDFTDKGCLCPDNKVFLFEDRPSCHDMEKEISESRDIDSDHELITYSIFAGDNFYSTNIYNYDLENEVYDIQFANFIAPNFLSIYFLQDGELIKREDVQKASVLPNVYVKQSFGDISPIFHIRFNKEIELSPRAPFYQEVSPLLYESFKSEKDYFYTTKGCLDFCKKEMSYLSDIYTIKRTKEYFRGLLAFDYITLKRKDQSIVLVKYDLLARTILERRETSHNDRELTHKLHSFSMDSSGELTREITKENVRSSKLEEKRSDWGNVVLCDNGLTSIEARTYSKANLVKGPNTNSVYGWLNTVNDQSDFFNGLINLNELGTGVSGAANHGFSVFSFMENVNVASISLNSCVRDFNNWAPNALKENFKVVNYSYFDSLDKTSCFKNHQWMKIQNTSLAKNMLWVFAAGNDKAHITPENALYCPQSVVTKRDNALVVGSDPKFGGVTNKGKRYVDLFVDAPSTSTAAAVVSSHAANISKKYPRLSIKLIKKSIIAGVENENLSSRTGGYLNTEKSFKAAQILNNEPFIKNKDLLKKLHCKRFWSCDLDEMLERF